jgi:DUF4097 and DUF4098 domain-containing protein YvlB
MPQRFWGQSSLWGICSSDSLKFETDHGPVQIRLDGNSDVFVNAGTTSGVVTCTVPGLSHRGQAWGGRLGEGQGRIEVRAVSGEVMIQPQP